MACTTSPVVYVSSDVAAEKILQLKWAHVLAKPPASLAIQPCFVTMASGLYYG
jgi:hypothetical protein